MWTRCQELAWCWVSDVPARLEAGTVLEPVLETVSHCHRQFGHYLVSQSHPWALQYVGFARRHRVDVARDDTEYTAQ